MLIDKDEYIRKTNYAIEEIYPCFLKYNFKMRRQIKKVYRGLKSYWTVHFTLWIYSAWQPIFTWKPLNKKKELQYMGNTK